MKSIAEVIAEYRVHPEAKSLGPDGKPCGRATVGLLQRRPVRATSFTHIGKGANELDEVDEGLVHDLGEVVTDYGAVDDAWEKVALPVIRGVPTKVLVDLIGVDRKTVQRTKAGLTVPHAKDRVRWRKAAEDWAEQSAGA